MWRTVPTTWRQPVISPKGSSCAVTRTPWADQVLQNNEAIGTKVLDCAKDLQEVSDTLVQGVAEVEDFERALSLSRDSLAESEAALGRLTQRRTSSQRSCHV